MAVGTIRALPGLDVMVVGDGPGAAALADMAQAGASVRSLVACADVAAALATLGDGGTDVAAIALDGELQLDAITRLRAAAPHLALVVVCAGPDADFRERARVAGAQEVVGTADITVTLFASVLRCASLAASGRRERRRHTAELRTLFDLGAHAMWVFDPEQGRFLGANLAAMRTYGYSEEEFLDLPLASVRAVSAPTDAIDAAVGQASATVLPPPGSTVLERHRRRNGSEIDVELFVQAVPLRGRTVLLLQARDVTSERRAIRGLETSERRFRDFFEHSTGFICIHDLDGILLSVNPAAAAALGRSVAELLGTPLRNLSPPELRPRVDAYVARIAACAEDAGYMSVQSRDGRHLVWQYRNRLYVDADGASYVMAYAQDITALRNAEQALRLGERRLRTIADTLPLKIAYIDAQQRIVFANESYRLSYAPDGSEIVGMSARELLGARRYSLREPFLDRAFRGERVVFEHEEGEDEAYACIEVTYIPELPENGTAVIGVHVMMQDVTEKKREQLRLTRLARIDDLTGVLNRASFYERLENAVMRARDQDSLLAVFYLDIDHFKQVNDTHGHATGDALIRAFAMRLADKVRASDVVARLGGDEFAIMMENVRDAAHLDAIAADLVGALHRPFELREVQMTLVVGASAGVALCRGGAAAGAAIVARADAMLYQAKQSGRSSYRITSMGASA